MLLLLHKPERARERNEKTGPDPTSPPKNESNTCRVKRGEDGGQLTRGTLYAASFAELRGLGKVAPLYSGGQLDKEAEPTIMEVADEDGKAGDIAIVKMI